MSDQDNVNENMDNENKNQNEVPQIHPQIQYIKDFSFEAPNAPSIFLLLGQNKVAPEVSTSHDVKVSKIGEETFEVTLEIKIECRDSKDDKKNLFILESSFGGVFAVKAPENILQIMLFVEAPKFLFPFARQIIHSTIVESGFPPLQIQNIDFMQTLKRKAEEASKAENSNN